MTYQIPQFQTVIQYFIIIWVLITIFILYISAHNHCFVPCMCFYFIGRGSDRADYGNFNWICRLSDFGWRWWTICLVYYWLVFLVLSNILFFGPFSRSFQFSPCKLYIFTVFFFFEDLSFQ